jgi:hypothetical protein
MTKRPRRNHTPAFKAKVALAAIKGEKTLSAASVFESKKKGRVNVVRVVHRACVQGHDAAANPGKLMLDRTRPWRRAPG